MQSALVLLFAFLLFVKSGDVSITFEFCLYDGEVVHGIKPLPFPSSLKGSVKAVALFGGNNFDLSFCAQQILVSQNVYSCSSEGKFNISNPAKKTFQDALAIPDFEDIYKYGYEGGNLVNVEEQSAGSNVFYPRDGSYYLSLALANYTGNNTHCVKVNVTIAWNFCDGNTVGPNCQTYYSPPLNEKTKVTINQGFSAKQFYQIGLTGKKTFLEGEEASAEYPVRFTAVFNDFTSSDPKVNLSSLKVSLRRGSFPELNITDTVATLNNGTLSLSLDNPVLDDYYVYVDAPDAATSYTIDLQTVYCPIGTYWTNNACSGNVTVIGQNKSLVAATQIDGDGEIHYFEIQNQDYLMFGVGTENLKDVAPSLSANLESLPSATNGLVVAAGQKVNFINVRLPGSSFLAEEQPSWFVALNATVDAYYWANQACPNNCSKDTEDSNDPNGLCNQNNGTCTCDKGYKGLFCVKDNKILWIILIVILVAIIIACIIGVPLAIHFKNKRRSSYETV